MELQELKLEVLKIVHKAGQSYHKDSLIEAHDFVNYILDNELSIPASTKPEDSKKSKTKK